MQDLLLSEIAAKLDFASECIATTKGWSEQIPKELKAISHWVVWHTSERKSKPTKMLYDAKTVDQRYFDCAKTNDPSTWCDFATAVEVARATDHGIGFVLTENLGICGIDLDHCLDGRKLKRWVRKLLKEINSYTEMNSSGMGIHSFAYGPIAKALKRPELQLYKHLRFLTITGNHVKRTPLAIEHRANEVRALYEAFRPAEPATAHQCCAFRDLP
jgi:putative DNA primase/helicase